MPLRVALFRLMRWWPPAFAECRWLLGCLTALLGTCVLLGRKPEAFWQPQFWAEDGPVYFLQAWKFGVYSLLRPYNGSFYLFQRLIAYVGNWVPVAYLPHFYNGMALLVTLAVMVYVLRSRSSLHCPLLCALAVVAIPQSFEVLMNLTNVHWILALLLLVIALADEPMNRKGKILELSLTGLAGFTGVFAFLFLPLFVARALLRRTPHAVYLVAILAVACIVGLPVLPTTRSAGEFQLLDAAWLGLFGNGISGRLLVSYAYSARHPQSIALTVATGAIYGFLLLWAVRARSRTVLMLLGAAISVIAAGALVNRHNPGLLAPPSAERYAYIPSVCIVWAMLYVMHEARWSRGPLGLVFASMMVAFVLSFHANPWPVRDYHWKEASIGLRGPAPCRVLVPPDWTIKYVPVQ